MSPAPQVSRTNSEIPAPPKAASSRQASPNAPPLRDSNVLKRSLTSSGAAAVQVAASHLADHSDASGELPPEAKKLRQTNPATMPPQVIPGPADGASLCSALHETSSNTAHPHVSL